MWRLWHYFHAVVISHLSLWHNCEHFISGSVAVIEDSEKVKTKLLHLTVIGEYGIHLVVTDSAGQKASAGLSVVVHPDTNKAPIANAGDDLVVQWPVDVLSLNGLQSSDDGEIAEWLWKKIEDEETPAAGMPINRSEHQPVLMLSGLIPGTCTFELTVKDVQGMCWKILFVGWSEMINGPPLVFENSTSGIFEIELIGIFRSDELWYCEDWGQKSQLHQQLTRTAY